MKPYYEITVVMVALDILNYWRANIFQNFGLFFFTILEDLLSAEYFEHFFKLI